MFKRVYTLPCVLALCFSLFTSTVLGLESSSNLNLDQLDNGAISYRVDNQTTTNYKLMIQKQSVSYFYNIAYNDSEYFPLQLGNGEYKVALLECVYGTQYKVVDTEYVTLQLEEEQEVFLNSIQNIEWDLQDAAIRKAYELTNGLTTDDEKIQAIYSYVVNHIDYDFEKISGLTSQYIPDISATYVQEKGICYDYASLFASMLRSQNIPTKLVMGTSVLTGSTYHAWNEVYSSSTGKWLVVDTTIDAAYNTTSNALLFKDALQYSATKVY